MSQDVSRRAALLAALVLLAAPASAKLGSKYDPDADFSSFQDFRWVESTKPVGPRVSPGGDLDRVIRDAVTAHLRSIGLEETDGEADLEVSYDAVAEPDTNLESTRYEITRGISWVVDGSISSFTRGTVVLIVRDADTGKPVWSAWTTEALKKPEHLEKQVRQVVKKLIRRFPARD